MEHELRILSDLALSDPDELARLVTLGYTDHDCHRRSNTPTLGKSDVSQAHLTPPDWNRPLFDEFRIRQRHD